MSRPKGIAPFSGNFEPQVAAPLDARGYAETQADLLLSATWTALDGSSYIYNGMTVAVWNDGVNNGLYILEDASNYTDIASWNFVGGNVSDGVKSYYGIVDATGLITVPIPAFIGTVNTIHIRTSKAAGIDPVARCRFRFSGGGQTLMDYDKSYLKAEDEEFIEDVYMRNSNNQIEIVAPDLLGGNIYFEYIITYSVD